MKIANVIIVILTLSFSINSNAQISRTILGMTLGVTTKSQCIRIFDERGIKIIDSGDRLGYGSKSKSISFAGHEWYRFDLEFYKEKLCSISLELMSPFNDDDIIEIAYLELSDVLYKKYAKYVKKQSSIGLSNCDKYNDNRTTILLMYQDRDKSRTPFCGLTYSDDKLTFEKIEEHEKNISHDL